MNKGLDKWDLCFVIYMFLSNNPSSGDINSSNLSCSTLFQNRLYQEFSIEKGLLINAEQLNGKKVTFLLYKNTFF